MKTGKRILSFFLALTMLLSCVNVGGITAFADEALGVVVELDKTSITAGEETTITATVSLTEATDANSFTFKVSAPGLTLTGISTGSSNVAQEDIDENSAVASGLVGWVNTQIEDGADVSIQTLAVLTFTAPASLTAADSPITLSFSEFALTADGGFEEIFSVSNQPTVTGDLTITVEEAAAPENSHTVTFVNHDGTVLQSSNVVEGEIPTYTAATPEKTVEGYVYTFTGWSDGTNTYGADATLPAVTGEVTYTAQFSQSKQKYTVTYTGDNINMEPTQHEWGTQVTPAIPTLDGYYFVKWTTTNTNVTIIDGTFTMPVGDVTLVGYFAKAADVEIPEGYERVKYYESPEYLTVSTDTTTVDYYENNYPWVYESGLFHSTNSKVQAPSQIAFTAERAGTLTMQYRVSTTKSHGYELLYMYDTPITNDNDDLSENYSDYESFSGDQAEFTTLSIPLKAGQTVFFLKQNIYPNGGGYEDIAYIKDLSFEALPIYTATFVNYDSSELLTTSVVQGDSPVYTGATPAKPGEDGVSYVFNGWTDGTNTYAPGAALPAATGDVTYTAVFTEVASSYTVTFVNYDGTVLETNEWAAGETPVYSGATPVKPKTDSTTYDFNGWDPEIVPAAGNATYTAQYVERERTPTFKFWWDAAAFLQNAVHIYTAHWDYATGSYLDKDWRDDKLVNGAWVDTWDWEPIIPGGANAWAFNGQTFVRMQVHTADIAENYAYDGLYLDGALLENSGKVTTPTYSLVKNGDTVIGFQAEFFVRVYETRADHEFEIRFKELASYPVTVDLADGITSATYTIRRYYDTARTVLRDEQSGTLTDGMTLNLTEDCELTIVAVTSNDLPSKITVNGVDVSTVGGGFDAAAAQTTSVFYPTADNSFVESGNTLTIAPDNGPSFIFTSNIEGAGFIAQCTGTINSLYYSVYNSELWVDEYFRQDTKYPPVNYVSGTAGQTIRFSVVPWVQNGYRFVGLYDSDGNRVDSRGEDNSYTGYKRSFDLTLGDGPQRYEMRFEKVEMETFTVRFDEDAFNSVTYRPYYYLYKDTTSQMQHGGEWTTIHDGDTITVPKNTVVQFKTTNKQDSNWVRQYLFKGFYVNDELITAKDPSQNAVDIMFGDGDSGSYVKVENCTELNLLTMKNGYEDVVGYSAEGVTAFQTRQDYPWHTTQVNGETVLTPGNLNLAGTFSYFRIVPETDGMLVFQYQGNTINGLYTGGSAENKFFYKQQASDPTTGTNILVGQQDGWKTFTLQVTAGTEYRFCFKQYSAPAAYPSSLYIKDIAVVPVSTYTINYSSADVNAGLVSATGLTGDTGAAGTAETGNDVTVTASAKDGYRFIKWAEKAEDGTLTTVCTTSAYTFAVAGDRTLVATFAPAFEGEAIAKINEVEFGSLDDALTYATGGDTIILLKDYTLTENLTIPKGITVQIPYSDEYGTTANHLLQPDFYINDYATPSVFRTFTVNAGVTLTVQGGLVVDSRLSAKGQNDGTNATPAGPGARLIVNRGGSVVVSSGGQMSVWGYATAPDADTLAGWNTSGETAVTVRNGGTLREAFQMRDWRGGTYTSNLSGNAQKVFPFSQYYVQNVELPLVIETGARDLVCGAVYAGGALAALPDMPFICSDGMFVLNSGSLKRTYDAATDRTTYAVDGNLRINNITLSVLGLVDVSSVDYTLPINSNLTVRVLSGSTVEFDPNQDVCFLPGSELIVEENATVNVPGKVYFYDSDEWTGKGAVFNGRDLTQVKYIAAKNGAPVTRNTKTDAKLLVGGTVNVLETGALYTTAGGANICGTGETGMIVLNAAAPEAGNTYQSKSNSDEANIITVPITAAQLMNADSTYTATAEAAAGTTFYYTEGAWTTHKHDYEAVVTEPTCTAKGYTTYTCDCGESYVADETEMAAHTPAEAVKENEVASTCTVAGSYDSVVYCSVCKTHEISRTKVDLPLAAHTEGEAVIEDEIAATCTTDGSYVSVVKCTVCGDEVSRDTITVPATGEHAWDEGVVTKEPTSTEEGEMTYTCGTCGATKTETIPATEPAVDENLKFVSVDLNLGAAIEAIIVIQQNSAYDHFYVEIERNGGKTTITDYLTSGTFYGFLHPLAAKEMADELTITVCGVKADGTVCVGEPATWSIKQGAIKLMNTYYNGTEDQMNRCIMIANMLNYGAEAQKHFDYNTENLATDGVDEKYLALIKTETPNMETIAKTDDTGMTITLASIDLNLAEKIQSLVVYKMPDADFDPADYCAVIKQTHIDAEGNETVETHTISGENMLKSGSFMAAYFTGLASNDLRDRLTITLYKGDDNTIAAVQNFSIESVCNNKLSSNPALYSALMNYGDCAKVVFG